MTEELAIRYAPRRVRERGFSRYRLVFQDLNLKASQQIELAAYNEIWFVLGADNGIAISSDYGEYDYTNDKLSENVHEHADQIIIKNTVHEPQKVRFIQVILEK